MTRHPATGADGGCRREQLSLPWPSRCVARPGAEPSRTVEHLADLLTDVWGAARVICASLLDVPQLEFKLAGAEAVYELTELAAVIEQRLADLGTRRPDRIAANQVSNGLARVLAADAATLRIAVIYEALMLPLLGRIESARDAADPVCDGPTARLLRHGHGTLSDTCAWFHTATEAIRAALGAPAVDAAVLDAVSGTRSTPCTALSRPRTAARDARLATFADTRDYRNSPDWRDTGSSYEDNLIELIRINRDEIDAVETFALTFFDLLPAASLETLRHLARLTWDESRHAAAGHALLAEHGFDPYDFSCSTIGIRVRAAMDGWDAWAQITLYGELGIIGPMRDIAKAAAVRGDKRTSAAFSFICSDEVMHLRESRRLLDLNHPAGSLERAAETVRQRAAACMDELNIMPREKYMSLTAAEIFARLGE